MRALKMRRVVAGHQKLTTTNWVLSLKLILLQLHEKLPKNSVLTILQSFGIWSKLERWKNSISRFLMSWPQIKKVIVSESHLLFCATTTNHFLIRLWHAAKSWFYLAPGDVQLSGWTNKTLQSTSQSQICTKKGHGYWWSAVLLTYYNFLNPRESITSEKYVQQTDEMHWKLQHLHLVLFNRRDLILLHDNTQMYVAQPHVV